MIKAYDYAPNARNLASELRHLLRMLDERGRIFGEPGSTTGIDEARTRSAQIVRRAEDAGVIEPRTPRPDDKVPEIIRPSGWV